MTTKTHTHYRYVSKNGRYRTRWRVLPKEGVVLPTKRTAAKLGAGYSLMLRKPGKKKA